MFYSVRQKFNKTLTSINILFKECKNRDIVFKLETKTTDYISIVTNHTCQLNCPYCIDKYHGQNLYISIESVKTALEFARKNNIKDVLLVGGEPTLHPEILEIAKLVKESGFNLIVTTNYLLLSVVKNLDKYVDSFNISYYHQQELPEQKDFTADLTLSTLISAKNLSTKTELDAFIDKFKDKYTLKFSTLAIINKYTIENQKVDYLDTLPATNIVLFDEILGQIYRGCIIKRHDKIINSKADQSYKCLVNGKICKSWDM